MKAIVGFSFLIGKELNIIKKFIKEFLISSAFIWVLYVLMFHFDFFHSREGFNEALVITLGFLFPLVGLIIILSLVYVSWVFRKDERKFLKVSLYTVLSWLMLVVISISTPSMSIWVQNQIYFGGQSEELKQKLFNKAEKSLEKKLGDKFEIVNSDYWGEGSSRAFRLDFKEEGNKKDYPTTMVYLSHEKHGWRMKIINGDIWYIEE